MFQSFNDITNPAVGQPRVALLRKELKRLGLAGFIVPKADAHQGEYIAKGSERLFWLTGFSGSAGMAAVLAKKAALFVDGRYTMQAGEQTDRAVFQIQQVPGEKLSDWLIANAGKGARIGYDPRLHTIAAIEQLARKLHEKGVELAATEDNPIDALWEDRPQPPRGAVVPHPVELAGTSSADKIARLRKTLKDAGEDAVVLTSPESISWLFNIRGSDLPHTPSVLSFAIAHASGKPELFVDPAKIGGNVRGHLKAVAELREPDALEEALATLGRNKSRVRLDPDEAGQWFLDRLTAAGADVSRGEDPTLLAKARKSGAEIDGARRAHRRDAVAMVRFLAWLDREAGKGRLTEIAAAEHLEALRIEAGAKDLSFDAISAAGPHAAMPHYRVSSRSNRSIERDSIYLIDSGGQYADGTTDVTRTIAVGKPPAEMAERFTLVLKGMIAVSVARFPKGTRGCDLDPFARRALWEVGLDFGHGTGHGVGSYLSVHEGPQRISPTGTVPLEPGMIISNEPGYYKAGAYGIRIENLVLVREPEIPRGGERAMMSFETLTLCPIDRRLIVKSLLSPAERAWLDAYHARVADEIGPELEGLERAWLEKVARRL